MTKTYPQYSVNLYKFDNPHGPCLGMLFYTKEEALNNIYLLNQSTLFKPWSIIIAENGIFHIKYNTYDGISFVDMDQIEELNSKSAYDARDAIQRQRKIMEGLEAIDSDEDMTSN